MASLDSTPAFDLGCYDKTKIYGAPPSPNLSASYDAPGNTDAVVLTTAGTYNGHQVIGVIFDDPGSYAGNQTVTVTDPGAGTNTVFDTKFDDTPGPVSFALICDDGFAVRFTLASSVVTVSFADVGAAVGSNHARRRILGYV